MRIHLKINANGVTIPFNHQHMLTGTIHKWIGINDEHGKTSLYSFSRLEGAIKYYDELKFKDQAYLFFSSIDEDLIKKLISGIRTDNKLFNGLEVKEIIIQEDPDLSDRSLFLAASPILIKRLENNSVRHILYNDPNAGTYLKETIDKKMGIAGLDFDDSLEITFDCKNTSSKTMMISYKGIMNRVSWCPVFISANSETKKFIWNVGLGNSTGIGLGAIR